MDDFEEDPEIGQSNLCRTGCPQGKASPLHRNSLSRAATPSREEFDRVLTPRLTLLAESALPCQL